MSLIAGPLQPAEKDGITFSVPASSASPIKTVWNNATVLISVSQVVPVTGGTVPVGVTVTFGSSTGTAPSVPSITNGTLIPPNTSQQFYLGPNRDSMRFFNIDTVNNANVSIVALAV